MFQRLRTKFTSKSCINVFIVLWSVENISRMLNLCQVEDNIETNYSFKKVIVLWSDIHAYSSNVDEKQMEYFHMTSCFECMPL